MGQCLNHETTLDHVRKRANETKDELNGFKAWKVGMEKKFAKLESVKKELVEKVEALEKSWRIRKKRQKMPRTSSVRQKRQRSLNIVTSMPSWRSSGPLMRTNLMMLFVKPRKLILILTFPNSTLTHRPKPLLNPLPLKVRRICLLTM